MLQIDSLKKFHKNIGGSDVKKTAKLLNLKSQTVGQALSEINSDMIVYKCPDKGFILHTVVPVTDSK